MAEAKPKKDPTISSESVSDAGSGAHPAVPIEKGADWVGSKEYAENPDKPAPDSVAQVEVLDK